MVWAQRHLEETGHTVQVYLYVDMRDGDWLGKLSPSHREEIEAVRQSGIAQALAGALLSGSNHLVLDRCGQTIGQALISGAWLCTDSVR